MLSSLCKANVLSRPQSIMGKEDYLWKVQALRAENWGVGSGQFYT